MKIIKANAKDVKVLLFIQAPFMMLLCYTFFGKPYFTHLKIFTSATLAAIVTLIVFWCIHIYADHFFRKKFTNISLTQKRIAVLMLFHFGVDVIFVSILFLLADATHFLGYTFSWQSYISGLLVGLIGNLAANSFHEGVYTFQNWKRTLMEAEELKKLTLKNRLAGLRNQTVPHFFFNSINTLSGLIEVDTKKADRYLDEMCVVYRYLLRNEPDTFVPLSAELSFIRSWMYIVQTRYGNSLQFAIIGDGPSHHACISRLCLLTFLEEIFDTYIFDKNDSFNISIYIKPDCVEIVHPVWKLKGTRTQASEVQTEEVKAMHRLLGLPEIKEQVHQNTKTIIIPTQRSETVHEHF